MHFATMNTGMRFLLVMMVLLVVMIGGQYLLLQRPSSALLSYYSTSAIVNSTLHYFSSVKQLQSSPPISSPDAPVNVIIVTQMRSGSSFTGEIFNQNDDFIYYFEPLYELRERIHVGKNIVKDTALENFLRRPLKNLFQCNFQDMPITWWHRKSRTPRHDCLYSRAFQTSTSFCKFNQTDSSYLPHKHVTDNVTKLEDLCNSKLHVAIKTIRVEDINHIRYIVEDPTLNVKIIHLVRDPRAVYRSRKLVSTWKDRRSKRASDSTKLKDKQHKLVSNSSKLKNKQHKIVLESSKLNYNPSKSVSDSSKQTEKPLYMTLDSCPQLERNLKYWLDTPKWLQNRYLLVRFEDLADRPVQMASDVYRFLGIKMPDSVRTWIKQNTDHTEGDMFSRTRNSHDTSIKWRTKLRLKEVRLVQSRCRDVMQLLGYREVVSLDELKHLNYTLLLPMYSNRKLMRNQTTKEYIFVRDEESIN